jgi:hypothetical protein
MINESNLDPRYISINTILPVYITLSTIPSRMNNTFVIIKHMLEHLSGIDKIIINIPYTYNRWPLHKIVIPNIVQDSRLLINRTKDYGPLTKFLPSLSIIPDESITIIADDMCYNLEAFKDIAERQDANRSKSYSFYVYNYKNVNVPQGADLISTYTKNVNDFIEWFDKFRESLNLDKYFDSPCFFVDDQVIGWYFQYNGIPMLQVDRGHRMIYIKNCKTGPESDNLNRQIGKNSRDNTMKYCYQQLNDFYPLP